MSEEDPETRLDPLNSVFPKVPCLELENLINCLQVAKCTFHKFGPSGTIEHFDGLCILSLNIINEKEGLIKVTKIKLSNVSRVKEYNFSSVSSW